MSIEEMNIQMALELLDISLDTKDLTKEYIKKKYHKIALKCHPDKSDDKVNATNKFQRINEAYEYLLHVFCEINEDNSNANSSFVSSSSSKESKIYSDILSTFISSIIKGSYNESIIKEIVIGYNELSSAYLINLFEGIEKQKAIDIYNFLCKYKDILYISKTTLSFVSSIIKDKYKNDSVFILHPSINDLLEHNIYKLYVDGELYLVPLWHNELYFDVSDGSELIVLCKPLELTIDDQNNIYIEKHISVSNELTDLIINNKYVSIELGSKSFSIPVSQLYMKKEQIYRLKSQGIAKIMEHNIYNIENKGDIIVKIILDE